MFPYDWYLDFLQDLQSQMSKGTLVHVAVMKETLHEISLLKFTRTIQSFIREVCIQLIIDVLLQ